jgi:hypothetical protein
MTVTEMARKGGLARAKSLSKKERIAIARKAGKAPKRKREEKQKFPPAFPARLP